MKIQKNFTTGILTGICGVLLLFILVGTTRETTNIKPVYEFYDLEDTRGLIFNNVTGEIKYEEIRETPLLEEYYLNLTNWNGLSGNSRVKFFD